MEIDTIYQMDCLQGMQNIPDSSIDMILCDLPYGSTKNKWDTLIPFDLLWKQYRRIIKEHAAIVLFADGLFTAKLVLSNEAMWRYNLIWDKQRGCDFLNANVKPLKSHEDICVFYKKKSLFTINKFGILPHINGQRMVPCLIIMGIEKKLGLNQKMVNGIHYLFCLFQGMEQDITQHKSLLRCWNG